MPSQPWSLLLLLPMCTWGSSNLEVFPVYWSKLGGRDKACRGLFPFDNSHHHYQLHLGVPSLDGCEGICRRHPNCTGIEYSPGLGHRCEVWVRPYGIGTTIPKSNFTCLRYGLPWLSPFDFHGGGYAWSVPDGAEHRACRGSNATDDSDSYYILHEGVRTLDSCLELCNLRNADCQAGPCQQACSGVEYHPVFNDGRCEVWTRPGFADPSTGDYHPGIGTTTEKDGFVCLRFEQIAPLA